jgi:uncharacterized protein with FMN-binding domain
MRRSVATVVGTLAGTVLLVGAKVGAHPGGDTPAVTTGAVPAGTTGSAAGTATGTDASTAPTNGTGLTTSRGKAPRTAPGKQTAATKTAALKDGTFNGAPTSERWGTIAVSITVSGGRITGSTGTCPGCRATSQAISGNAFPALAREALAAQSAHIATVSGATYTSGAYRISLQSALDAAHA